MAGLDKLSEELRRITESQYTPSLQRLYDILQNVDSRLLQYWAQGNACQIEPLAAAILEGLELWPFTLDILRRLACIRSFRDAVIRRKPLLLDTLLTRAIESESTFDRYSETCVSLLSHSFDAAVPASFEKFLSKLGEKVVRSLSPETIRPIYRVLSAVGSSHLDGLSFNVVARLQDRLVEVLTKLDMDERFGDLYCLGVLARFASRPQDASEMYQLRSEISPTGGGIPKIVDRYVSARKLFEMKRAPKTLDLAVIRAITACSESCTLSPYDICESLKLAAEVINAFDCREKQTWFAKNAGKVRKLHKKILRPDIDPEVQCAAINLLAALSDEPLPPDLVPVFEGFISKPSFGELSDSAISQYIIQLDKSIICQMLLGLLQLACEDSRPSRKLLTHLHDSLRQVSLITAWVSTSSVVQNALLSSVSSGEGQNMLRRFATQLPASINAMRGHDKVEICPSECVDSWNDLNQRLSVVVLSAALNVGLENSVRSTMDLLLEKQTKFSKVHSPCRNLGFGRPEVQTSRISLFEAGNTPRVDSISHNWRKNLVQEMSRDAECRYESLTRMVGDVCRDLEFRCNEVERPLREEQSKSHILQTNLEASETRVAHLKSEAQAQNAELEDLNYERVGLLDQIKTHKERLRYQCASLEELRQEFDRAKVNAERAAQNAMEDSRQQDLAYMATLTGKDEMFEEQALKLSTSEELVEDLRREVARHQAQALSDAATMHIQKTTIQELNIAVTTANDLAASKQAENDRLAESEKVLTKAREEVAMEAQKASERHGSLVVEMREELQSAKGQILQLRHEHASQIRAKDAEIARIEETLRSSIANLQSEVKEAYNNATLSEKQCASTIADLQSKIKSLRREREDRAREFAEAKSLSARLHALTGNQAAFVSSDSAGSREEEGGSHPSGPGCPDLRISEAKPACSLGSSASSQGGPTPKRARKYRSSQFLGAQPATATRSNTQSAGRRNRVPLTDLGVMQDQGFKANTLQKEVAGERLQENGARLDSDDGPFGGGDIFTSTDQHQLSALRKQLSRSPLDETTTEF